MCYNNSMKGVSVNRGGRGGGGGHQDKILNWIFLDFDRLTSSFLSLTSPVYRYPYESCMT